ncbi:SET domain-containing protein [Candidatus Woesearchaeota archaeon]|nr:SET domain-containing protein [Candidatus Woesearchaeota archaeon]
MALHHIVIQESAVHGKGVFANQHFKKGDRIFMWDTSVKLRLDEVEHLLPEEKKYVTSLDEGVYLLLQPPERYVNHSCSPNLEVRSQCDVALRDIEKGEELTTDYSREEIPDLYFECNCKSSNCRGVIAHV